MHGSYLSVIETNNENQNKKTIAFVADVKRRGGDQARMDGEGLRRLRKLQQHQPFLFFCFLI